jgi:hypothetical protein
MDQEARILELEKQVKDQGESITSLQLLSKKILNELLIFKAKVRVSARGQAIILKGGEVQEELYKCNDPDCDGSGHSKSRPGDCLPCRETHHDYARAHSQAVNGTKAKKRRRVGRSR